MTTRNTHLSLAIAFAICLTLLATGTRPETAEARSKPTVGNAREMAASALDQWFNPMSRRVASSGASSNAWSAVRGCRKRGKSYRCSFNYMPGNTVYKGRLTVSKFRVRGAHFVGRVTAKGYSLRVPPKRYFRRSGTFRSLICGDACRR